MSQNGNTPEVHIHPPIQRNGFEQRTFVANGRLSRLVGELDEDLQPHSVVEILGHDGDEVVDRIPIGMVCNGSESMARACVNVALAEMEARTS